MYFGLDYVGYIRNTQQTEQLAYLHRVLKTGCTQLVIIC